MLGMSDYLIAPRDRKFVEAVMRMTVCNPFIPERNQLERLALGDDYTETPRPWNIYPDEVLRDPNIKALKVRSEEVAKRCRENLLRCKTIPEQEIPAYAAVVNFNAYYYFRKVFDDHIADAHATGRAHIKRACYREYEEYVQHYFCVNGEMLKIQYTPTHMFAFGYQLRRAYYHIFGYVIGTSDVARRLRARIWQSIFTHDLQRYLRALHTRMGDIITLITGPSGSGKELVAQAIALSRYIPFDERERQFADNFLDTFYPINLTALSPTLIESELFGHRKGAFTGALQDRPGYLETCGNCGTVFLDEVGDVDPVIQVKMLRVLQTRSFQRLGDTQTLPFEGKIMAATNKDLVEEIEQGRFREDFYYRLCADQVQTPALKDILAEKQHELSFLVHYIAGKVAGESEADALTDEVCAWVTERLGLDYAWPGNFRELEQCVRNILIHREYHPHRVQKQRTVSGLIDEGTLSADQLMRQYVTRVYAELRDYKQTAARLDLDPRTVKKYVDDRLLLNLDA